MFAGIYTAIVTPFRDGKVDWPQLDALIDRQIRAGVAGVVPCGTTGESPTLTDAEHAEIVQRTVSQVAGRCQVIAGVGSNSTAHAVTLARAAAECGADAGLTITPYYNKPTQAGMAAHFGAVARAVPDFPLVLYNVPGRTGVCLSVDTIDRLADHANIVSIKEATGNIAFDAEIIARCDKRLSVLSGDDPTAFPMWAVGGRGVISVTSNLVPERMVHLWNDFEAGRLDAARRTYLDLLPLFKVLFIEASPAPLKAVMSWVFDGLTPEVRLPLTPILDSSVQALRQVWHTLERADGEAS